MCVCVCVCVCVYYILSYVFFYISGMLSARGRVYLHETEGRWQMCAFEGR